jgi:predicted transcriptional regulator YheO
MRRKLIRSKVKPCVHPQIRSFEPLVDLLADFLGKHCEVVLHDFTDLERSIVKIANGHITGRKVGDPVTDLGLQMIKTDFPNCGYIVNYPTQTKDGRTLRSASILIRDFDGKVVGGLCINWDIWHLEVAQTALESLCSFQPQGNVQEMFENSVQNLVGNSLREVIQQSATSMSLMTKTEKLEVVKYLESKGIFFVKGSVPQVAKALRLSVPSIYNYLKTVRNL